MGRGSLGSSNRLLFTHPTSDVKMRPKLAKITFRKAITQTKRNYNNNTFSFIISDVSAVVSKLILLVDVITILLLFVCLEVGGRSRYFQISVAWTFFDAK